MSTTVPGVVKNGVVVPKSPLPEGARVEIHLMPIEGQSSNAVLNFHGHIDPNDELAKEFQEELALFPTKDNTEVAPPCVCSARGRAATGRRSLPGWRRNFRKNLRTIAFEPAVYW